MAMDKRAGKNPPPREDTGQEGYNSTKRPGSLRHPSHHHLLRLREGSATATATLR